MKLMGKVIEYNGFDGYILDDKGKKYLLLKKDILNNDKIKQFDNVTFTPEEYNNINYKKDIARFIRKVDIYNK